MVQYLTYDEYLQYGGTLNETDFVLAEFSAQSRIDRMTLCRVQHMAAVPEEVKLAMMTLMKVDSKYGATAHADSAIVSSFSTDGYSESYGGVSEQTQNAQEQATRTVERMLFGVLDDTGVPLTYRGVG